MQDFKSFPIQRSHKKDVKPHPMRIPWYVAEKAYSVYASRYGVSQSLERLAERGGFCPFEMDDLLPGWRDEVSEVMMLRTAIGLLEREHDELKKTIAAKEAKKQWLITVRGERACANVDLDLVWRRTMVNDIPPEEWVENREFWSTAFGGQIVSEVCLLMAQVKTW